MDRDNLRQLEERRPAGNTARIELVAGERRGVRPGVHRGQLEDGHQRLRERFLHQRRCDKQGTAAPAIVATLPVCGTANQDSAAIQNGLLPGYINFTASTQAKGLDLKAVIGFWPGTSSGHGINNNGTTPDTRTVYLEFGSKNWGSFKLGRDIGLFQQNAILNDMTLLSVGTGAGFQGAINTTLGMIGNGYIYSEFQPQITYTTPNWNGFNLALGAFQPRNTAGVGGANDITDQVGWQGLAQYEWKGQASGKVWASFATQGPRRLLAADRRSGARILLSPGRPARHAHGPDPRRVRRRISRACRRTRTDGGDSRLW